MQDFRKLVVWEKAHQLVLLLHRVLEHAPTEILVGLRAQMLRAAVSIAANLAEGCGRPAGIELARFAEISLGSAKELEYELLLARDLGMIAPDRYEELDALLTEVRRMLIALSKGVRARAGRVRDGSRVAAESSEQHQNLRPTRKGSGSQRRET